jgi:hypothetical protein
VSTEVRPALSICVVARDTGQLPQIIESLATQSAPPDEYELVVVDASEHGLDLPEQPDVTVSVHRADPALGDAALLDRAWRNATHDGIAFLASDVVPAWQWVEGIQRRLGRGRRVVSGSWLPSPDEVGDSGPLSYLLWAGRREVTVATTDQLACLRADLERIGGVPDIGDPDRRSATLAARLVDAGADPSKARHALVFHPVDRTPLAEKLAQRRARTREMLAVLDEHPRARARLMPAGVVPHIRHAEVLLLLVGVLLAIARRDRRALLLAVPYLHERIELAPPAGGPRRKLLVLPGTFAVDVHDTATSLWFRLRRRQPGA